MIVNFLYLKAKNKKVSYLLNPRYTCPNVPRPRSFPFLHLDTLLVALSNTPFGRVMELESTEEGLVGEPGGRGNGWHSLLPSSCFPVGESRLKACNLGWSGEVGLVGPLDPGPGLFDLTLNLTSSCPLHNKQNMN